MTATYCDTSALRHLLIEHPVSSASMTSLVQAEQPYVSALAMTELHRVGVIVGAGLADVDAVLDGCHIVSITDDMLRAAGLMPSAAGTRLGSLDAIHIQAALAVSAVAFVTSDVQQAANARDAGLAVELLPTTTSSP